MKRLATFDIGKVNYAFYVEEFDEDLMFKLRQIYKKLPKNQQRKVKGKMNPKIQAILKKIYTDGKFILSDVLDIREDKESKKLDIQTRKNLFDLLESYRKDWEKCDFIRIEQQFFNVADGKKNFGKRNFKQNSGGANIDAIKLGECTMSWFLINFPDKDIEYFGSMYKTQTLGAPDKMTKSQRKKWAIEEGRYIYELRGDDKIIEEFNQKKNAKGKKQKQDDLYDCTVMAQAYKYRYYIGY